VADVFQLKRTVARARDDPMSGSGLKPDYAVTPGFLSHSVADFVGKINGCPGAISFSQVRQDPYRTAGAGAGNQFFSIVVEIIIAKMTPTGLKHYCGPDFRVLFRTKVGIGAVNNRFGLVQPNHFLFPQMVLNYLFFIGYSLSIAV
jgi:hypothetical protein